jgi:secreted PhoX family phosphatase
MHPQHCLAKIGSSIYLAHIMTNPCDNPDGVSPGAVPLDPLRRRLLSAAVLAATGSALSAAGIPLAALAAGRASGAVTGFTSLSVSTADAVRVAPGHQVGLLYAWGDPVSGGPQARADASDNASEQSQQAGMHHDGMHYFPFIENGRPSSTHGLLCVNHEYTDDGLLHAGGMANWDAAKVDKAKAAVGVSVVEIRRDKNGWQVVRPSTWARRITADTPCRIAGPARGHAAMRTAMDTRGEYVIGTLDNCAMGFTPWGTYLTCEENFNGYFKADKTPNTDQQRYGLSEKTAGWRWHEADARFDLTQHPNEANRFGWVVEIDPWHPDRAPVKRTALGRFKHEGATVTQARDGRIVVYMGDDEHFEYIYKFVSRDGYQGHAGDDLLDHGTLYVARFDDDGRGRWLPLVHGESFANGALTAEYGFAGQGEVSIRCRQAADLAGATKMDRPEWIAVHPQTGEVYVTLTNNSQRDAHATGHHVDAANPRAANIFGHILRWREAGRDAAAAQFTWDIFALAGDPQNADGDKQGNIQGDVYANPDGLWFDPAGRLWIQTDISTSSLNQGDFAHFGNNQMLVADVHSGETRRFLTGPRGCELTGITATPDGRTLFVNIQHPGELGGARSDPARPTAISAWPANQFPHAVGGRPRSATLAITREDGQPVAG